LTAVSFSLALAASILLLVLPVYSSVRDGRHGSATLIEVNGLGILVPLSVPVFIALLPLVFPKLAVRICATIVIWGFAFLGGFSIGLFYIPSALALLLGTCVDSSAKIRDLFP